MSAAPLNLKNGDGSPPGLTALVAVHAPSFIHPGHGRLPATPQLPGRAADQRCRYPRRPRAVERSIRVLKRSTFAQVARVHPRGRGEGDFEDFESATIAYARALSSYPAWRCGAGEARLPSGSVCLACLRNQSARPGRGRCRAQCEGESLREKQQIGAQATAEAKRQLTLDRLVAAYRRLADDGVDRPAQCRVTAFGPQQQEWRSGPSRSVVKHWSDDRLRGERGAKIKGSSTLPPKVITLSFSTNLEQPDAVTAAKGPSAQFQCSVW